MSQENKHPTRRCTVGPLQYHAMGTLRNETEEAMASCEHLVHAEEQMRDLLGVINEHLKLYDPNENTYGSLLSVAHHVNEGLRELGYLLDQAEEAGSQGLVEEVGH